jgi:hypothetical protein
MPNNARTQQALAAGQHFRSRVKAALAKVAYQVLDEDPATEGHTQRANFARQSLANVEQAAYNLAPGLVMRTNVFGFATTYDFELGVNGEVITASGDIDLEAQMIADWNLYAGVTPVAP